MRHRTWQRGVAAAVAVQVGQAGQRLHVAPVGHAVQAAPLHSITSVAMRSSALRRPTDSRGVVHERLLASTLTERMDVMNVTLTQRMDAMNATLTQRMDVMGAAMNERFEKVNARITDLASSLASAKVWALVLYVTLAGAVYGTLARAMGWL